MSYAVFTDTSANLPLKMASDCGMTVIPLFYRTPDGEKSCLDPAEESFDGDAFYAEVSRGTAITTSQITPNAFMEQFRPVLESGQDLLYVGMSSGISGTFASATSAAQELREEFPQRSIELVDTLSASLGEGIVALEAAACRDRGMTLDKAAEYLRGLSKSMCQVFTVDDLMHLRRGGRLSNLFAIVGTVLNIKPILIGNENGQIVAIKKIRGRRHAVRELADCFSANAKEPEKWLVGIAHAGCKDDAELLKDMLLSCPNPPANVLTVQYEPVTGAHVGPGALALFFLSDSEIRTKIQA